LWSATGLAVIYDILALYERDKEMEFRPGLELDKCCYLDEDDCFKLNFRKRSDFYDWKYIYNCYKTKHEKIYDIAELCFLSINGFSGKRYRKSITKAILTIRRYFPFISTFLFMMVFL